jgi:hypothetical protein
VFGAILDPAKNLAKGIILVVLVTVISASVDKMISLRQWMKELTNARTDLVLQKKLRTCTQFHEKSVAQNMDSNENKKVDLESLFAHIGTNFNDIVSQIAFDISGADGRWKGNGFICLGGVGQPPTNV